MKHLLKLAGVVTMTGMALAACGSTSTASHHTATPKTVAAKYGWDSAKTTASGSPELILPYAGVASPNITTLASADFGFYKEVINPHDWVYSPVFGKHVFVGPYTSGSNETRAIQSKMAAWGETAMWNQVVAYRTAIPATLDGYDWAADGQKAILDNQDATIVGELIARHRPPLTLNAPSEATVIESPVGSFTPAQTDSPNSWGTTVGACIPHTMYVTYANGESTSSGYDAPHTSIWADYGELKTLFMTSQKLHDGVAYNAIASCSNMP